MYRLDDEKQRVVAEAAAVAEAHVGPHAARVDRTGSFPKESIAALGDRALLGLTVPTAFGGLGHGFRTMAATLDILAQHCSSTAMVYLMHLCGVACYAASPDTAGRLLRAAAAGRHLTTLAFSEKGSRSHFWAPVSRAVSSNGEVRINASKSFVTSAGQADAYVVSTLAPTATTPTESSIYVVLRDDRGVRVSGSWQGLGMRGNASAPMTFDNVTVGGDRALTEPGKGFDLVIGTALPAFQIGSAAIAVGIAEAAVQATVRHMTRTRFEESDTALSELPTLRAQLARMRIETDRARAHLVAVIDAQEAPRADTQLLVLEAKVAATEAAVAVTDMAMRTCGGAAFSGAHGIDRLFRDARAPVVMAPTTDQAYDFIGRSLCGVELL